MEETYIRELFLFQLHPSPLRAVFLFCYENNLLPQDRMDMEFIPKEYLQTKFNWYLVEKMGISANYNTRIIWQHFGRWGINRVRTKDHKTTFYGVSKSHLLGKPAILDIIDR
jgi:hypothetical protein